MKRLRRFFHLGAVANEAVITGIRRPLGYQQILAATLASSTALTVPTIPAGMSLGYAVIQAEAGAVRWRDDGSAPTSSVGMLIPSGGELNYCGDFKAIRFIEDAASSGVLNITYYA